MAKRSSRKPRAAKRAPPANGSKRGDNGPPALTFDEQQALFLSHRGPIVAAKAKFDAAKKALDELYAAAKKEGIPKKQFEIAADLAAGLKKEAKRRADVETVLRVARYIGHAMGEQFDLFSQPDRTPLVDRAYQEGRQASLENRAAKPDYAPDTEAYRAYMAGFHDDQKKLGQGFKSPEIGKDGEPIKSGSFVPRSAFSKTALDAGVTGPAADALAKIPGEAPEPSPLPPAAQGETEL